MRSSCHSDAFDSGVRVAAKDLPKEPKEPKLLTLLAAGAWEPFEPFRRMSWSFFFSVFDCLISMISKKSVLLRSKSWRDHHGREFGGRGDLVGGSHIWWDQRCEKPRNELGGGRVREPKKRQDYKADVKPAGWRAIRYLDMPRVVLGLLDFLSSVGCS